MSTELERRLAEAYRSRADLVTEERLRPLAPLNAGSMRRLATRRRVARWGLPLLAAASVLLVVALVTTAGGGARAHRENPVGPPLPTTRTVLSTAPSTAPSVTHSSTLPTATGRSSGQPVGPSPLARGQVGSRVDVPWGQVGDGWTVALWSSTSQLLDQSMYLVDPLGGRYQIAQASLPHEAVVVADVSPDRRRALLVGLPFSDIVYDVDLMSGQVRSVQLPLVALSARYAGSRLPGYIVSGQNVIQLVSPEGVGARSYPLASVESFPLVSADGTQLVLGGEGSLTVTDQGGRVLATLPVSAAKRCTPVRWWRPGVVLARCNEQRTERLRFVPLDGSAQTALPAPPSGFPGFLGAWSIQGQTFVAGLPGCGADTMIGRFDPSGQVVWQKVPPPVSRYGLISLTGVTVDAFYGITESGCTVPGRVLARYDPISGAASVLFGGELGGGYVDSAVTFGVDR